MVEEINGRNGFLGRPVEYVLLDDQSKPEVARSLYEKLITVDKVDLIQGPYATAPILAAMGVAQRYGKVMIQSSMGIPKLQTYDRAFPATPFGPEPNVTYPNVILDAMATFPTPPKTMVMLTVEVPVGAVHGAGHEGAGGEAGREGAALSRIRIGQSRLRRHRRAREGGQCRFPVGRLARAGEQPAARVAAQARLHAEEPLPSLSGAGAAGALAGRRQGAVLDLPRARRAVHEPAGHEAHRRRSSRTRRPRPTCPTRRSTRRPAAWSRSGRSSRPA